MSGAETKAVDGNVRRHGPYSYLRINSGWGVYKSTSATSSEKIAEVPTRGEDGRQIAGEIVAALNSRARWLEKQDFNKVAQ